MIALPFLCTSFSSDTFLCFLGHREIGQIVEDVKRALSKAGLNGIFYWETQKLQAIDVEYS